ncbi:MAG: Aminotransferase, class III, partial [uncultured Microvirga sp.]
ALESRRPRHRNPDPPLHPAREFSRDRAADPRAGRGRVGLRHRGQALHRGHGRAVVHGARLFERGADRGGRRADAQAALHASVLGPQPRPGDRAGRKAEGDRSGPNLKSVLHGVGLGGERHAGEARLVHEQRARPTAEEEDHCASEGLSRGHGRGRLPHRPAGEPHRFRPADRQHPPHLLPAPLPLRRARRERDGLLRPTRSGTRGNDPAGRARHGRGLHRRTGDGGGRRDHAAGRLFSGHSGRVRPLRHAVHRRRGDLRFRAARRHVRLGGPEHPPRHDLLRQGGDLRLSAARRRHGERGHVPGDARREPQDRHLWARLHLFGPPGLLRGRGQGAGDLRARPHPRPGQGQGAPLPGPALGLGRSPAGRGGQGHGSHRRPGDCFRQGHQGAVRCEEGRRREMHEFCAGRGPDRALALRRPHRGLPAAHHHRGRDRRDVRPPRPGARPHGGLAAPGGPDRRL